LTDWTKDDVDEDSKFWNWMDKDKKITIKNIQDWKNEEGKRRESLSRD